MQDQDSKSLQAQNIGETEVPDTQDTRHKYQMMVQILS